MASKIGVYFDLQNIGGGLDVEALAEQAKATWGELTPVVKSVPVLGDAERQLDGHERLVKEGVLLFQKAPDAPLKDRGGHREGRLHVVGQPFPELCCQYGWDHGQFLRLCFTDQTY